VAVGLWLAGVGCATSKPSGGVAAPPSAATASNAKPGGEKLEKGNVTELAKRERPPAGVQRVTFPDGRYTGEVEGVAAATLTRQEGFWQVDVPIGTGVPVTCFLYDKPIDAAGGLSKFVGAVRGASKDITVRSLVPTDAGAVGDSAYMAAVLTYTKSAPAGLVLGQLKMLVRPDIDAPLLCYHDEVGYSETFKRVVLSLARTLEAKTRHVPPQYVEIQVARAGEIPVGFDRRTIDNLKGKKFDETVSCMLLPVSADELNAQDHIVVEQSTLAGRVLLIESLESDAGEITTHVTVTRKAGREYEVKGTHSGKAISGAFKSKEKDGLPSKMLVAGRLRDSFVSGQKRDARELKIEEYQAGLSPLSPVEVIYRGAGKPGELTILLGTLELTGHVDARGIDDGSSLPMGSVVLRSARVFERGTP
jgi:hypothetical protein